MASLASVELQHQIIALTANSSAFTVVMRQQLPDCYALYDEYQAAKQATVVVNRSRPLVQLPAPIQCYGCGAVISKSHPVYIYSCKTCGRLFEENRYLDRDLTGKVALVTGCRTKLGHQIVRKLLDAGATVLGLTRSPAAAQALFAKYADYATFAHRLHIYQADFDVPNLIEAFGHLFTQIHEIYGVLDILVNSAAQTIRTLEKNPHMSRIQNRYGDAHCVVADQPNSWCETMTDLGQPEMEELFRINAIAPTLLIQTMLPLLQQSTQACIVNVHAREGNFACRKSKFHMQTNMAKAALAMSTLMLCNHHFRSKNGKKFLIHGVDPGWFSANEYYEGACPWLYPPLDEIDGAARILYPVFKQLSSQPKTRKHFLKFLF